MPGLGRHLFQLADHAAAVIHLNLFIAGLAVKHVLVVALNTQLADIVRRRIIGEDALFVEALDVFIVDL